MITTTTIPTATYKTPYEFSVDAVGGAPPYAWKVAGVPFTFLSPDPYTFPKGFTFSSNGVIKSASAREITAGNYHIVVFVTDSTGNSVNQPLIFPVTCTDDRDPLTKEYRANGAVDPTGLHNPPACVDYTKSASSSIFS
jgi:hypothetical protein